jgi:N-acetyl-gamma-glutamyl-phosphate reductase
MNIYSVAIVGVTGYSGRELERWLRNHPSIKVSGRFASKSDSTGIEAYSIGAVRKARPDIVVTATEHDVSMRIVPELVDAEYRVVDMSGAFRMKDAGLYPKWYGFEHSAPEVLAKAVYGLPELFAEQVRDAKVVAHPGCYATSVIVPLAPLYAAGVIGPATFVVADGKSGVSGAGRHPKQETHFCEVNENLRAYGVLKHRHTPEMLAYMAGANADNFVFTPHLIPITRGILTTIVFQQTPGLSARAVLADKYAESRFVRLLPEGSLPEIHGVVHTNACHISVNTSGTNTVLVSAIDNLVKGAAGQALENLNLMLGLPVDTGLRV